MARFEVDSQPQALAENKRDDGSLINQLREIHMGVMNWRNVALCMNVERADLCLYSRYKLTFSTGLLIVLLFLIRWEYIQYSKKKSDLIILLHLV